MVVLGVEERRRISNLRRTHGDHRDEQRPSDDSKPIRDYLGLETGKGHDESSFRLKP